MYLYQIRCTANNRIYIGKAINYDFRIKTHFQHLKNNSHFNGKLQQDFNSFGIDSFHSEIIKDIECIEEESNYIKEKSYVCDLYNKAHNYKTYENLIKKESKRLLVYMPEELYNQIVTEARLSNRSASNQAVCWLDNQVKTLALLNELAQENRNAKDSVI